MFDMGDRDDSTANPSAPSAGRAAPPRHLHIAYATTFEAMEGLDVLVRAAHLAAPTLGERGVTLKVTLAGTGREWDAINALVDELKLRETVDLPGFVPYGQMPDFYRGLDLFVVPRRQAAVSSDTTPLKPLEALACGKPLLVSDLPAMRELLQGRTDVRFVTPDDPRQLADAVVAFAEQPWTGTGQIADRSWSGEVQRYPAIYDQATARAAARHGPGPGGGAASRRPLPVRAETDTVRDSMTEGALGGVGSPETSRIARWQQPTHHQRISELLAAMPELPEALIDLGYESDARWTEPYQAEMVA